MDKNTPISEHPFFVIYRQKGKISQSRFDSPEEARIFLDQNAHGYGYEMLGLYNYNTRKFLEDGMIYDSGRRQDVQDYVDEIFPTETMRAKREKQNRESIKRVLGYNGKMFAIIGLTIGITFFANKYLGIRLDSGVGTCLAAFFYSGGTLGYLADWSIKTFGGKTMAEKISQNTLVWSYIFGTVATVLSLSLS